MNFIIFSYSLKQYNCNLLQLTGESVKLIKLRKTNENNYEKRIKSKNMKVVQPQSATYRNHQMY